MPCTDTTLPAAAAAAAYYYILDWETFTNDITFEPRGLHKYKIGGTPIAVVAQELGFELLSTL